MVCAERKVAALLQQRLGPYLVGPAGPAAAARRHRQADVQGGAAAEGGRHAPVLAGADHLRDRRVRRVRGRAVRRRRRRSSACSTSRCRCRSPTSTSRCWSIFAIASMGVYGIVLAGWSSNSKYSLLGGLRSSAQMISYELSYGLALAARAAARPTRCRCARSSNAQAGTWFGFIPRWFVFLQPLGFLDLHDRRHRRDQPRAVRLSRRPSRSWSPATTPSTAR